MKNKKLLLSVIIMCLILALCSGCAPKGGEEENGHEENGQEEVRRNGEVYIIYTSDVHCGIDQGFGYAGVTQIRNTLEAEGYTTILVDNGDSIQGETIGTLTKGEAIIELMNGMGYDIAVPGNHEFDYGTERFLELTEKAEFPYICCNFTYRDELVFEPYIIKEAAGLKIGFVGVTTPSTITTSTPSFFQDSDGEYIYGFMQDDTGEKLYSAVQSALDEVRSKGADLVYVLGHMGMYGGTSYLNYADIIEHTSGIDVFLDGHSHDTEQVVMKDRDGNAVVRSACGTKLSCVGYSHISADGEVIETGIWSWTNDDAPSDIFGYRNETSEAVDEANRKLAELTGEVVAHNNVDLTINDPEAKDDSGNPIRMVRRAETNLGDFCTDVLRKSTGADIGVMVGGNIRTDLRRGDITYGDILKVLPFQNGICVIKATGQQILDALEWGARNIPGESGGFLQVSGLMYEIYAGVPSGCIADGNGMMTGIEGERRVRNVMIDGVPIDPEKTYTIAGTDYTLIDNGDGYTAFDGAAVVVENAGLDSQVMIDYITDSLGGVIGTEYEDPYGQGRITIIED